jgi:hypothetical protein
VRAIFGLYQFNKKGDKMKRTDAWLTFKDDFIKEFYKELPTSKTYAEAYEKIEQRYSAVFNRRRFKDYGVFRSTLSRWLKENR